MNIIGLANRPEESRRTLRRCNVALPCGELAAQPSLSLAIEHGPGAMLMMKLISQVCHPSGDIIRQTDIAFREVRLATPFSMMIRPLLDLHGVKLAHRIRAQRFNISSYSSLCGEIQNHIGSLDKAENELQTQILLPLERLAAKQ